MAKFLIRLLISATAVVVAAYLLPGVSVNTFLDALIVALVIGFLDTFLEPLLILVTLPITILTFGLFLLVINALIILLADHLISGFEVNGILWAIVFSFIVSIVSSLLKALAGENDKR